MPIDWNPLRRELSLWRAEGLRLPIWWRDDDAVTSTPALEHLTALATDLNLPVHLAVIPAFADRKLARVVAQSPLLQPCVHGWDHNNHALRGQKKAEFGRPRAGATMDLTRGLQSLQTLFGARLTPAFVAPWNRLHPQFLPDLLATGYRIVSTHTPRSHPQAAPGLLAVNTHIDPIDWRGTRDLVSTETLIAQAVQTLADRRSGHADRDEPLGLLTHHLVHTPDIWSFCRAFLSELRDGGAVSSPLTDFLKDPK